MSDRQEIAGDDEIDVAVSSTYRAGATEKVPGHLDRMVLAEVRREAGRTKKVSGLQRWLVPAAFTAVLALSLSFNLEFNRPDVMPPVHDQAGIEANSISATPVESTDDLETAVESTGKRLRALDDAVSSLAPGNQPESATVGDSGQSISRAVDAAIADKYCGAEAKASAETWWSCIESLQRSGQSDAARAELELLEAAFPQFELVH